MEGITLWVKIWDACDGVGEIFFSQAYNRLQHLVKRVTNSSLVVFLMDYINLELEQLHRTNKIGPTCNPQASTWIASYSRRFGVLGGKDVLEDQNLCLMKDYKEIKDPPIQNDFVGDEICQKMTANDDLWETYIKVIGTYVGIATVGIFILWYTQASFMGINLVSDGHTLVEFSQICNWGKCLSWTNFTVSPFTVAGGHMISFTDPCDYFTVGKVKAMTLSSLSWCQLRCSIPSKPFPNTTAW